MRRSFDRHLNIFWGYNGRPYSEDNLTRAFITTLSSLEKIQQIEFINWFTEEKIEGENLEISFDLQNPYLNIEKEIKKAKKRIMIGFNPSGKYWGNKKYYNILNDIEGYQFEKEKEKLNSDNYVNYLSKKLPLEISELKETDELGKSYAEKIKDIILSYLNRGGSRPDAWIFVHKNNILEMAIAIETKLWDLDPEQLANHCKECLDISKEEVKYKRFKETFDKLKKLEIKEKNIILDHFLDYMEKIGYYMNIDMITAKDFDNIFVSKEEDSEIAKRIFNRKLDKYFKSYFKSKEYEKLKKEYSLEDKYLNKRWISIEKIGVKGLGNIYFDTCFENNEKISLFVGTEIGVAKGWHNQLFSNKLKDGSFKEELNKLYPQIKNKEYETRFELYLRVNQISYSRCIYLKEDENLNKILDLKEEIPFEGNLSRVECVEKLKGKTFKKYIAENNSHIQNIEKRGSENSKAKYNIMSYLRFIDYIKLDYIMNIDEDEFNIRFSKLLEKHLNGLQKINSVLYGFN